MHNRKTAATALSCLFVVLLTACGQGGAADPTPAQPTPTTKATPAASSRPVAGGKKSTRVIGTFGSGVPGTPQAVQELQDASEAGFTELVNYNSMNAESVADVNSYLATAKKLKIGIIFSVKDVLSGEDPNPAFRDLHRRLYGGASAEVQAVAVTKLFVTNPAVTGVLIADEVPDALEARPKWLAQLKHRRDQIHKIAPTKPVMVVLYYSKADVALYASIKKSVGAFGLELFPFPQNKKNLPQSELSTVGRTLDAVAGDNGRVVIQAFGWGAAETLHPQGRALGYTKPKYAPPKAADMVEMTRLAVEGGAHDVLFTDLSDGNPANPQEVKIAVKTITSATWWLK